MNQSNLKSVKKLSSLNFNKPYISEFRLKYGKPPLYEVPMDTILRPLSLLDCLGAINRDYTIEIKNKRVNDFVAWNNNRAVPAKLKVENNKINKGWTAISIVK